MFNFFLNFPICNLHLLNYIILPTIVYSLNVEIESASFDYSGDQDKNENKILVVSVSDRGKQIADYSTCSCIYTVEYEIKGDRGKMLRKTIEVGNVP